MRPETPLHTATQQNGRLDLRKAQPRSRDESAHLATPLLYAPVKRSQSLSSSEPAELGDRTMSWSRSKVTGILCWGALMAPTPAPRPAANSAGERLPQERGGRRHMSGCCLLHSSVGRRTSLMPSQCVGQMHWVRHAASADRPLASIAFQKVEEQRYAVTGSTRRPGLTKLEVTQTRHAAMLIQY